MEIQRLIRAAIDVLPTSYVPYSHFHVAAALLCGDGTVYTGINIENAAYTPTVCAERSAFFRAVNEGKREFAAIVVCGGKDGKVTDLSLRKGAEEPVVLVYNGEEHIY